MLTSFLFQWTFKLEYVLLCRVGEHHLIPYHNIKTKAPKLTHPLYHFICRTYVISMASGWRLWQYIKCTLNTFCLIYRNCFPPVGRESGTSSPLHWSQLWLNLRMQHQSILLFPAKTYPGEAAMFSIIYPMDQFVVAGCNCKTWFLRHVYILLCDCFDQMIQDERTRK